MGEPRERRTILAVVPAFVQYCAWMGSNRRSAIAYPVLAWCLVRYNDSGITIFEGLIAIDGRVQLVSESRRRLREYLPAGQELRLHYTQIREDEENERLAREYEQTES
jgi:hypothetical protein